MCCLNNFVADWGCAESADYNAAVAAECADSVDSVDSFHLVLQNEMENPGKSCSWGEYCC